MVTIERIDETAVSWAEGSDFDFRFEAAVAAAANGGTIEVIDASAISWVVGGSFDRFSESAIGMALKRERLASLPSEVVG